MPRTVFGLLMPVELSVLLKTWSAIIDRGCLSVFLFESTSQHTQDHPLHCGSNVLHARLKQKGIDLGIGA